MRGRKTGGRDFKPGEGGRPKGAKNKVPGSVKAEIKAILGKMGVDQERAKDILQACVARGRRNPSPYLPVMAMCLALQAQANSRNLGCQGNRTETGPNW